MAKKKTPQKRTRKKIKLEPEEKQKLPYIPLYTGDYIKDTRDLSLEAKGAWSDMILLMWSTKSKGVLIGSVDDFTRRIGSTSSEQTSRILTEIAMKKVADVTKDNDGLIFTVTCRRLAREARISDVRTNAVQNRYKSVTNSVTNSVTKGVQNTDNEIENESEVVTGSDSDVELYGKCENFFHGAVPEDLIELSKSLKPMPEAGQWQDYVQSAIESIGYEVMREQIIWYTDKTGRRIKGRIDLVVEYQDRFIGIELDYRQPRLKSIRKVESFDSGMVLLRDPKPVDKGDYKLTRPSVKVPAKQMVVDSTGPTKQEVEEDIFSDYNLMDSFKKENPAIDLQKLWSNCWKWYSVKPSPPVHAWEWKQKLMTFFTNENVNQRQAITKSESKSGLLDHLNGK